MNHGLHEKTKSMNCFGFSEVIVNERGIQRRFCSTAGHDRAQPITAIGDELCACCWPHRRASKSNFSSAGQKWSWGWSQLILSSLSLDSYFCLLVSSHTLFHYNETVLDCLSLLALSRSRFFVFFPPLCCWCFSFFFWLSLPPQNQAAHSNLLYRQ